MACDASAKDVAALWIAGSYFWTTTWAISKVYYYLQGDEDLTRTFHVHSIDRNEVLTTRQEGVYKYKAIPEAQNGGKTPHTVVLGRTVGCETDQCHTVKFFDMV